MQNANSNLKLVIFLSICVVVSLFAETADVQAVGAGWYSQITQPQNLSGYSSYGTRLMLPYNGAFSPGSIGPYLDEAQRNGIKVWVDLRLEALKLSESDFRQIIRTHRNHSALKGWYISDEPEYGGTSASTLETYYNYCKQEDPNHPVAIAHANSANSKYVNGYDVLMVDFYPGWTQYDPNEFNWMVRASYSRWGNAISFAKQYNKEEFVAVGVGWGAYENGTPWNGLRDLSYEEFRFHVFTAIVQGADDFLFWWDQWTNTRVKPIIEQMISQINQIGNEMENGTTNTSKISVSHGTDKVVYRYGIDGDRHVVLAVNIAGHNVSNSGENLSNVRFSLPSGIKASQVEVLDENRTLPIVNGSFTDNFQRFEVHAYRFIDGNTSPPENNAPAPPTGLKVLN